MIDDRSDSALYKELTPRRDAGTEKESRAIGLASGEHIGAPCPLSMALTAGFVRRTAP